MQVREIDDADEGRETDGAVEKRTGSERKLEEPWRKRKGFGTEMMLWFGGGCLSAP